MQCEIFKIFLLILSSSVFFVIGSSNNVSDQWKNSNQVNQQNESQTTNEKFPQNLPKELDQTSVKPPAVQSSVETSSQTIPQGLTQDLNGNQITEPDGKTCSTADNRGLHNLLREAQALLPIERLRNILATALTKDTDVQELRTLLLSDDFRAKVARLHAVSEYAALNDYVCKKLQLDYSNYIAFIRNFLHLTLQDAKPTSDIVKRRPGIRGLLQDLGEALPRDQLRALYRKLLGTDRELSSAIRRIRSSEFRRLLRNYRQRSEFREVFDKIEKAGVSLRAIQQLVGAAIGWGTSMDIGAETTLINV